MRKYNYAPVGAADNFEAWIYDENSTDVIAKIMQTSALESLAHGESMGAAVKDLPRGGGFSVGGVAKGGTYTQSTGVQDSLTIIARKLGGYEIINEEDFNDPKVDVLAGKRRDAARTLAVYVDNSAFATTAAASFQTGPTSVNYDSVYRAVRTNGDSSSIESGYVADDNYAACTTTNFKATLTSAAQGYGVLDLWLAKYEESEFFEEDNTYVVASHKFRSLLRNVKDGQGNPYLIARDGSGLAGRIQYDLFGYPTVWSRGLRTSAVSTDTPTGNPLLIVGSRRQLIRGDALLAGNIPVDQPGFALQRGRDGIGFLADQAYMKAAVRRGFKVGTRLAHSVLEVTP